MEDKYHAAFVQRRHPQQRNEEMAHLLPQSKVLVAFGSCACEVHPGWRTFLRSSR
jgi:coenzyme F420-reducing hydrogenase gamma subunit